MTLSSTQISGQLNNLVDIYSIKVSFNKFAVAYEKPVLKRIVLNTELGLSAGFSNYWLFNNDWEIKPLIRIEPRFYYNLLKRQRDNKIVLNNSYNYFAFNIDFHPGVNSINHTENVYSVAFIPKWGLKRAIKRIAFFELATGYGLNLPYNSKIKWAVVFDCQIGFKIN